MKRPPLNSTWTTALLAVFLAFNPLFPAAASGEEREISLSEAVLKTLRDNPGVQIERERVIRSEGELQAASGMFDWTATSTVSREQRRESFTRAQEKEAQMVALATGRSVTDSRREQTTAYSLGLQKQFRTGPVLAPSLSVMDIEDMSRDIENHNRSELGFDITIPLMRGLGEHATGAQEKAAYSNLTANRHLSRHNVSSRILLTANNYWNCLAAMHKLSILEETEERAVELFMLVERLVQAGEMEPAVLREAEAQLFQRRADLQGGRLLKEEARQSMALAMGYSPRELPAAPLPVGYFPVVVNDVAFDSALTLQYVDDALRDRGDYLAARAGIETEEILKARAENEIKPRLDLGLRVGISGLSEKDSDGRYFRSPYSQRAGPNAFVSLTYQWPIANNAAKGEFVRRNSLVNEARLTADELANAIASEVIVAVERIRSASKEFRLAARSARSYRDAADNELFKVRQGLSRVSDLIAIEDRYYNARAREVDVLQRYASALAEVRYATGSLLTEEDDHNRFKIDYLMTPPVLLQPNEVQDMN